MDAVIAGSVDESDTMDLGSVHNTQGTDHTEAKAANLCDTAQKLTIINICINFAFTHV